MAPHYQDTHWAVAVRHGDTVEDIMCRLLDAKEAMYNAGFDAIIPINPQRHAGYLMFLVYSAAMPFLTREGVVPVVVDLTTVGGHYYATSLPQGIEWQSLWDFLRPQTSGAVDSFDLYIGSSRIPCPAEGCIYLSPGDVITALRPGISPGRALTAHQVFADPHNMEQPSSHPHQLGHAGDLCFASPAKVRSGSTLPSTQDSLCCCL